MSDAPRVYKIDVTKKYILKFQERLNAERAALIAGQIDEWIKGDKPFLLIDLDVKLVRVETDDEQTN